MVTKWKDGLPIYMQLRDLMADAIMKGSLCEGDSLPSVRAVAVDMKINPLTASKAYQGLVKEGLVEKRRGIGMFVMEGARARLLKSERTRFIDEEWPSIVSRIKSLDIDAMELLKLENKKNRNKS